MATSLADLLRGYGETALTLGTGAVAAPLGGAYGVYKNVTSPYYGTQEGINFANQEAAKAMNAMTYMPRGQEGQQNLQALGQLFQESKLPPIIPEVVGFAPLLRKMPLSNKPTDIGAALEKRRVNEYQKLVQEYAKIKDSEGGKVLSTDIARELSPEYLVNRTRSAEVHEPSSTFTKQQYAERLSKPVLQGSSVLFTGGGTGAGKTSSLAAFPDLRKTAEMIYDTNMNKLESAQDKIDQALKAGRKVDLVFTYRDPVEALVEGSLKRAMRMKEELGSGRTVPLKEHLRTHIGSREVIGQLQDIYGDNPNVRIGLIDNRYGKDNPKVAKSLDELPAFDPKQLEKDLRSALEQQYKSGKIDKDIYEASQ